MGDYLNPVNIKFKNHLKNPYYVDKSGLIGFLNNQIENDDVSYFCVTRPRRFGKSYIADMLTAYYSRGCDSHTLFNNLKIAEEGSYKKHLNKFNVIYFDVSQIINKDVDAKTGLSELENDLVRELGKEHRFMIFRKKKLIPMLNKICKKTHKSFIFVIDEWDCPFRERKEDSESQELYLQFLKDMLKNREYVSLAYMTGILPIKKYGTNSALNMFDEFTMLNPGPIKNYIGFTEDEVEKICAGSKFTVKEIKDWYDGYTLDGLEIYNPNSVVSALRRGKVANYWTGTEAFEDLLSYIKANVDGLHDALLQIFANEKFVLDVRTTFPGDLVNLKYKEDYIIALIHLGYLSYDSKDKTVTIPNHEVRIQFEDAVSKMGPSVVATYYDYTKKLLNETLSLNAKGVATMLGKIFSEFTKMTGYTGENDFGNFVYHSYLVAEDCYDVVREAPTRWQKRADYLFYPNLLKARAGETYLPGIIIELKNNKSAKEAIDQIEDKGYDDYFEYRGYHGDVIHVGLDFKKMRPEERKALAAEETATEDGVSVGNDAGLDTQAKIVHICKIQKYRI